MRNKPTIDGIRAALTDMPADLEKTDFLWALLECFKGTGSEVPANALRKLKEGTTNLAENKGTEVIAKLKLHYVWSDSPRVAVTSIIEDEKIMANRPKFVIAANSAQLVAYDVVTSEWLDLPISEIMEAADFLHPLAGIKKYRIDQSIEIDVKATQRMGTLFDELRKHNKEFDAHHLNVFLARLLFCYYAEDTGIFPDNLFTESIGSHTDKDGSGLDDYLVTLFERLDVKNASKYSKHLQKFPYVNGSLFETSYPIPHFSGKARRYLIENGEQDWKKINPDIFGSMFQVVIDPALRHELGAHYTSRENIMKVISPLFLDSLMDAFEKAENSIPALRKLHQRITNIRIFDPACGSGNFLIMAYGKLRELETLIYETIDLLSDEQEARLPMIHLDQFYGIEIEDFARELAILSMWIKEHQMNLEFQAHFGVAPPMLPLKGCANIVKGNATSLNWDEVCPKTRTARNPKTKKTETVENEIYVLGNPPYIGSSMQNADQKAELATIARNASIRTFKNLDYISCWFLKASDYIKGSSNRLYAFVSTNSICQGEHASLMWKPILEDGSLEINFCYTSFKWKNEASNNAGVTCVVVGVTNSQSGKKKVFADESVTEVKHINEYLYESLPLWVGRQNKSISGLPRIVFGSKPTDGGFLNFTAQQGDDLVTSNPDIKPFMRHYAGAQDFINKNHRRCLWIEDKDVQIARSIPEINEVLNKVTAFRLGEGPNKKGKVSKNTSDISKEFASQPHRFLQRAHQEGESIIFPRVTSERRTYIPLGFLDGSTVINDQGQVIYNAQPWLFGVLTSKMHVCWTKLVAGRLKTDMRYSNFVYNNFPCPPLNKEKKDELEAAVNNIVDAREEHFEKTYGELYDPDKMPKALLDAHRKVDAIVDKIYRPKPFKNDTERTQYLVNLYLKMTQL